MMVAAGAVEYRLVFLLVDGIADVALPQLLDMTPLQVANSPVFDAVAASGLNGLMDSVEPGRACGSDTSHLGIFGYEPRVTYRGRGAFESIGAGCRMAPGDIAFKSNLATLDEATGVVRHRRVDRTFDEEGPVLCAHLDGLRLPAYPGYSVQVKYATEHRCGVVVSGPGLSDAICDTDPLKDDRPLQTCTAKDNSPEAAHTAAVVNYVSDRLREELRGHAVNAARAAAGKNVANVVLLRGCGVRVELPDFHAKHGLRACIVAPTKILGGLGSALGMDWLQVPGTTGSYDSLFHLKAEAVCAAVAGGPYEFGFAHVKAVDDTGHDRLWQLRVRYLELMDRLLGQIVRRLHAAEQDDPSRKYVVMVTGDHSTPVMFGDHSHEPVPLAIAHVADVAAHLGPEAVAAIDLGPLPPLTQHVQVPAEELLEQARQAQAGWAADEAPSVAGDEVTRFDEVSAARGSLGRFPSSELMTLVKQVLRRTPPSHDVAARP